MFWGLDRFAGESRNIFKPEYSEGDEVSEMPVVEVSSGNVFADLGLKNAQELGTKVRLCFVVNRLLQARGLTQVETAQVLGVSQPKVSTLRGYKLEGFSVERLMHFVTALEHDVVIEIRPKVKAKGEVRIVIAA